MEVSESFAAFKRNNASIESLVRCADVYSLHALSIHRGAPPDTELIQKVITQGGRSSLARSWQLFMKKEEYDLFGERGHLRSICEHIVFASYVAVESYLIGKYGEYFHAKYAALGKSRRGAILKKMSLRSLEEIRKQYAEFLDIHIANFEPLVGVYKEAPWFHPSGCWNGLKILARCRNNLAHTGEMKDARLVVLVDAWSVFEFCREWVNYFEINYNDFVYRDKKVKFEVSP